MVDIVYYGMPPTPRNSRFVHFIDKDSPADRGQVLPPKHVNAMGFDWGFVEMNGKPTKAMVPGAAPLALAICCHALASDERGMAIYQRFKLRVMDKWEHDKPWSISAQEVAAIADQIESDEMTPQQIRAIERDRPPPETEGGRGVEGAIVWDTDEKGNWIKPRHGGE